MPSKTGKSRYWSFLMYEDSAPSDYMEQLTQTHLPIALSPWHDSDIDENAEGGPAPKKKHRHGVICFAGPTTQSVADRVAVELLHSVQAQECHSIKGAYRYFTHMDNPEKAQYDPALIECLNGFAIEDYAVQSSGEVDACYVAIENIIKEQDFEDLDLLADYLSVEYPDLARFLRKNTYYINQYLKSRYLRRRTKKKDQLLEYQLAYYQRKLFGDCDPETGELLVPPEV